MPPWLDIVDKVASPVSAAVGTHRARPEDLDPVRQSRTYTYERD